MERKKVAVLLPWLKMGGTNKIGLNFMNELAEYCDVTLILSEKSGELLPQLNPEINLIVDEMMDFRSVFKDDLKRFRIVKLVRDCIYYGKIKLGHDSVDNFKYMVDRHGYITDTEFDCAISYHGQSPERLLNLIYRVHAKKKVAWIHGEISSPEKVYVRLRKYYEKMDRFFFVSKPTLESFIEKIPFDRKKATVYYNPIDKKEIMEKASWAPEVEFDESEINILTVGRVSKEKGQDMIPEITKRLLEKGHKAHWYIIGDGDMRADVERKISELGVEESVTMLGTKTNPYCYMKNCDIYVQPSYTEGYSTTICEAGMLGCAIVGTEPSGGIRDQITDGEDGMIVGADVTSLTEAITSLIETPEKKRSFEEKITKKNFEGKGEIEKFIRYLDENN